MCVCQGSMWVVFGHSAMTEKCQILGDMNVVDLVDHHVHTLTTQPPHNVIPITIMTLNVGVLDHF